MNFILCVLLVYNDNGSVQTLCITRVIYLHFFHVFGFRFIKRYHRNDCVSLENPTVCVVNGRA